MNSEVTAAGDSTVIAEMLSPLYKLLYKLQYEVLISYVGTPVPRRETTVSAYRNGSFQPWKPAFPSKDTGVSVLATT